MTYLELHITCDNDFKEIIIAELDFLGADSISELDDGLSAAFENGTLDERAIVDLQERYPIKCESKIAEKENWNKKWEENFEAIQIDNCSIRASFHPVPENVQYDIVINPKMSFGTGHHETTALMVTQMLSMDWENKSVLDMGTGTGILAILAEKLGANKIVGIDIDDWSVENSLENTGINECSAIEILSGDSEKLQEFGNFEIIIANINRNILLDDMETYRNHLQKEGRLLLSGFYKEDKSILLDKAQSLGLQLVGERQKNNWMLLECTYN